MKTTPTIGFVIPTLNEEKFIDTALSGLSKLPGNPQIVVCDGGSTDKTLSIVKSHGITAISSKRGRGIQLNEGAKQLSTDFIAFIHADTILLPESYDALCKLLSDTSVTGGAFLLQFKEPNFGLKFIAFTTNLRTLLFKAPYGDQVIFVKTDILNTMGGVPELPIFEDVELAKSIKRFTKQNSGLNFRIITKPVLTSGRKYQKKGVFKTLLFNKYCWLLYYCGVDVNKLAVKYYS